jgi:protein-disulfide isomerase
VNATPAFFINGRLLSGAQPFDAFKAIIDDELGK